MRSKTNELRNIKCGNMTIQLSSFNEFYDKASVIIDGKEVFSGNTIDMYMISELFNKFRLIEDIYKSVGFYENEPTRIDFDKNFIDENIDKIFDLIKTRRINQKDYWKIYREVVEAVECIQKRNNGEHFSWE